MSNSSQEDVRNQAGYFEKEIQNFLAENLDSLGIDELQLLGLEYPVGFGRIDILAKAREVYWVIELKRDHADRDAIGQIQSYIGAVRALHPNNETKGILIARGLTDAGLSALNATPNIVFYKYSPRFIFSQENNLPAETLLTMSQTELANYWGGLGGVQGPYSIKCRNCHSKERPVKIQGRLLCPRCSAEI